MASTWKVDRYEFCTPLLWQPGPNRFNFRSISQRLSHIDRRVRLAPWVFTYQDAGLQSNCKLPRSNSAFLAPLVRMPTYEKAILIHRLLDLFK